MGIMKRQLYTIADQAIGYRHDTSTVLVAQRWDGFAGGRQAFVLSTNDQVTTQRAGTKYRVTEDFTRAAGQLAQWVVTETQARDLLERLGVPRQRGCVDCGAPLPLGGLYCLVCGLNQTIPTRLQPPAPLATVT
jgi:hypothetical protein